MKKRYVIRMMRLLDDLIQIVPTEYTQFRELSEYLNEKKYYVVYIKDSIILDKQLFFKLYDEVEFVTI